MGEQGVSDMLLAAIRDGYTDTWFVSPFGDGRQLASTATGSRPGESFADTVYAYVYSRVLRRIAEVAAGEDLMSHKTLEEDMGIYGRPGQGVPVQATDATWAQFSRSTLMTHTSSFNEHSVWLRLSSRSASPLAWSQI